METYKRRVPIGMRAMPGHVPSTVFNKESLSNGNKSGDITYHLEEIKSQKRAQTERRNVEKRKDLEMLSNYNPWGKPGGGARRQTGQVMTNLDKSLNEAHQSSGSFADNLNKPGCGAPYRTDSGNPVGVVQFHADIRRSVTELNEEMKKKTNNLSPVQPQCNVDSSGNWNIRDGSISDQRFHKSQVLECKQKTSEDAKNYLKDSLDKQVTEKQTTLNNEKVTPADPGKDWSIHKGSVGYVHRDASGKIARSDQLTQRDSNGLREFYDENGEKSIVEQFGKPGPGVAMRTDSGSVQAQPRGTQLHRHGDADCEDPFRPRNSGQKQVFPVEIEHEANERAMKRLSDILPPVNKHTIENGYYAEEGTEGEPIKDQSADPSLKLENSIGTVYSAILRTKDKYLNELRQQMDEKQFTIQKQKEASLNEDYRHMQNSDIFGRPGNGAPRLVGGSLNTNRNKLNELATLGEGLRNPGVFRHC